MRQPRLSNPILKVAIQRASQALVAPSAQSGETFMIADTATIAETATVADLARITDYACVEDLAVVGGASRIADAACIAGFAHVGEFAAVRGFARVESRARVAGQAVILEHAVITGTAQIAGTAWVTGHAWVGGNAILTGVTHLGSDARIERTADYITICPLNSQDLGSTLYRTARGTIDLTVDGNGCNFVGSYHTFSESLAQGTSGLPSLEGLSALAGAYYALRRLGTRYGWLDASAEDRRAAGPHPGDFAVPFEERFLGQCEAAIPLTDRSHEVRQRRDDLPWLP
jgi:carbonic anhydrase/acetyltransferase-like protein (isoleucine patch superfamily)